MHMIYDLDHPVRCKAFGQVTQRCGGWHGGRRKPNHIVLYCTDGEMHMQVEEEVFHLKKGDVLLIARDAFYKPLTGGGCQYYFLHFEAETKSDAPKSQCSIVSPHEGLKEGYGYTYLGLYPSVIEVKPYFGGVPFRVKTVFERAAKLRPHARFSDQLLLDTLARELLVYLSEREEPFENAHLARITSYIEEQYAEKITLSMLARQFSLSESYIARLFRIGLSLKPSEYVNKVRMSAAKTLLMQTDMSIGEIAQRVGYSDVYYFSKIFKKYAGLPPSALRK